MTKFQGNVLNLSENIAKSLRRGLLFWLTVHFTTKYCWNMSHGLKTEPIKDYLWRRRSERCEILLSRQYSTTHCPTVRLVIGKVHFLLIQDGEWLANWT